MDVRAEDAARIRQALARAARPGPPRLEVLWPGPAAAGAAARLALLPGSFDPMTVGHAALAGALLDDADLVLLTYSVGTLPKEGPPGPSMPLLGPEERVASLMAYCRPRRGFGVAVCSHGLYADQAEAAGREFPHVELRIGVGSDKVPQIFDPAWYDERDAALERLFAATRVAYAVRAGDDDRVARALAENPRWAGSLDRVNLPAEIGRVSSRSVREALARGSPVGHLVPPEVLPFLEGSAGKARHRGKRRT